MSRSVPPAGDVPPRYLADQAHRLTARRSVVFAPCPAPWSFAGPASTTCKNVSHRAARGTGSSSSRGCRARASPRSLSTRSTPRASVATSSRSRPMPASSSARWTSPTSTSSRGCRPPSRSTRSPPRATPARRSGPITEIYDYLRLLYARIGQPHCPKCGRLVARQSPQQIVDRLSDLPEGTRFQVLAPVVRGRKGRVLSPPRRPRQAGLRPGPRRR